MTLGHETLDVYRLSIGYVAWVYEKAGNLKVPIHPDDFTSNNPFVKEIVETAVKIA